MFDEFDGNFPFESVKEYDDVFVLHIVGNFLCWYILEYVPLTN